MAFGTLNVIFFLRNDGSLPVDEPRHVRLSVTIQR
jgi:hypothetical protein